MRLSLLSLAFGLALWASLGEAEEALQRYRGGYSKDKYLSRSPYNGGSVSDGGSNKRSGTSYTRMRNRKGVRGAAVGGRGQRTAYEFKGKKKTKGRGGLRFRRKPRTLTMKQWESMTPKQRQQHMTNLRSASTKNTDGTGATFGQNHRNKARPMHFLTSRSKTGKRGTVRAYGSGCKGDGNFRNCKDLNIMDKRGEGARIVGRDRKKGESRGMTYLRKRGQSSKPYFYRVDCESKRAGGCASSPSELRSPNGDVWKCEPRKRGDVTVTKCCKNFRRCVTTKQDTDGTVYISKGGVQSARTKCKNRGPARSIQVKDESGRVAREQLYEKYECGTQSSGTAGTNANDIDFSEGVACDDGQPSDKRIKIDKPKYYPDKVTRGGTTIYEFPHCGRMEAWAHFQGFSQAELKWLGPRLAFQMIVNMAPAGQIKCQDTSTCLTNRNGPNKEDNCYYCDLCNKSKHKVLATADNEGVCQQITSGRVKLSIRICPFNEDTGNGMCATSSKSIQSTYGRKAGDVDVKIMLYMRETSEDQVEAELRKDQANSFTWKFMRRLFLKGASLRRGNFATSRRLSESAKDAWVYEQYIKEKSDKGVPLTCEKFTSSYEVFGSSLTKFADALDALNDPRKIWKERLCASYERHLLKKARELKGR